MFFSCGQMGHLRANCPNKMSRLYPCDIICCSDGMSASYTSKQCSVVNSVASVSSQNNSVHSGTCQVSVLGVDSVCNTDIVMLKSVKVYHQSVDNVCNQNCCSKTIKVHMSTGQRGQTTCDKLLNQGRKQAARYPVMQLAYKIVS